MGEGATRHRRMMVPSLDGPRALRLDWAETRAPGPGEVRLAMRGAGVNFPDLLMTEGKYQFKPELPFCPGLEAAGEVVEVGPGVADWRPGDRAIARTGPFHPAFSEQITLPADLLLPVPPGLDDAQAAGFHVVYWTALHALADRGRLSKGETLVVHGAAGGVGLAAVQVGLAMGARVIATAGGAEKCARLRAEGAHDTVDYLSEDLRARLKDLTGGRGADVVLDPVGGAAFEASLRAMAPEGRLLVVGFAAGSHGVAPANIALIKEIEIIGVRAGQFARRHPEAIPAGHRRLTAWIAEGRIAPRVARSYPLTRAAEALEALRDRAVIGKVVVTPD